MKIIKAPDNLPEEYPRPKTLKVFLAGSIEMGTAENWQNKVTSVLQNMDAHRDWKPEITVLNPRRDDWDSSWVQSIENTEFCKQVDWELSALEAADVIVLWFDPATKSPISLLELGLYARYPGLIVYCPEGFWRKGNVDIVCTRYGVPHYESETEFFNALRKYVEIGLVEMARWL